MEALNQNMNRTSGKTAQHLNILAAKMVAETVRSTLGAKGMDKLILDHLGNVTVTNDGVTILEKMNPQHPIGKMMVEIAKIQEAEVGDGTTTTVVLAGELLKKAEELLDKGLHPVTIIKGFELARDAALKELISVSCTLGSDKEDVLKNIAMTSMTGKASEKYRKELAELVVEAFEKGTDTEIDFVLVPEGVTGDTQFYNGIVLNRGLLHSDMPSVIDNPMIGILDCPLEVRTPEMNSQISIANPVQLQGFLNYEQDLLNKMLESILKAHVNVVFCKEEIDPRLAELLSKNNVLAFKRIYKDELEKVSKATSAKIYSNWENLSKEGRGTGTRIVIERHGEGFLTQLSGVGKYYTFVIKGSSPQVREETRRALTDAVGCVRAVLSDETFVGGAGSVEMRLSESLKSNVLGDGLECFAFESFAEALEIIPMTLCESSGKNPMEFMNLLKSSEFDWPGVDVFKGEVCDAMQAGILEPLKVKVRALNSAVDLACTILRIDDVIAANNQQGGK